MREGHRSGWLCALALGFGAAVGASAHHGGYQVTHDDAYISFRYAANAIAGRGLVFNPGEHVWGFTSPLQTLLLAAIGSLGFELPTLSLALGLLWISLTACLLYRLARRWLPGEVPAAIVALYALTYGGGYSYLGLETNLLIFLEVLFLVAIVEGRSRLAAAVGALACLARPDAIVLVGPILLATREGRRPSNVGIFLGVGALWMAFAWGAYGDLLPNTFHAKRGSTQFSTFVTESARWLADPLGSFDSPARGPYPAWRRAASWLLVLASLLPILSRRFRGHRALLYAMPLFPWVLIVAYGMIGAPVTHRWEYFAAFFFLRVSAVIGLLSLPEILGAALPRAPVVEMRRWLTAAVAVPLAILIARDARDCFLRLDREQGNTWYGRRFRDLSAVARYINANIPRGETLLLLEVGVIGYLTDMRIIDQAGLTTKGFRTAEIVDIQPYLRHYRPRYLLFYGSDQEIVAGSLRYRSVFFKAGEYRPMSLLRLVE